MRAIFASARANASRVRSSSAAAASLAVASPRFDPLHESQFLLERIHPRAFLRHRRRAALRRRRGVGVGARFLRLRRRSAHGDGTASSSVGLASGHARAVRSRAVEDADSFRGSSKVDRGATARASSSPIAQSGPITFERNRCSGRGAQLGDRDKFPPARRVPRRVPPFIAVDFGQGIFGTVRVAASAASAHCPSRDPHRPRSRFASSAP